MNFLFRLRHWRTIRSIKRCPCGTAGSCVACAGANEYLREQWKMR